MENEFANKSVLITGATSGIGRATVLRFAEAGASISAVGRDDQALKEVQSEVEESGRAVCDDRRRSDAGTTSGKESWTRP